MSLQTLKQMRELEDLKLRLINDIRLFAIGLNKTEHIMDDADEDCPKCAEIAVWHAKARKLINVKTRIKELSCNNT